MPRPLLRRAARRAVLGTVLVAVSLSATATAATADLPTPQPAVALPVAVDAMPTYVGANSCDATAKPGVLKFAALVQATYAGTGSSGIVRDCKDARSLSEHTEGRAWDWRVSTSNAGQVAQVNAMHDWLLATDAAGNRAANARRLGVMYIVWDRKILSVYNVAAGWRPYACTGVTACHEDHVHYSFTWAGAQGRTSFWTGTAAPTDYGPCRQPGTMFARPYSTFNGAPCPTWKPLPADSPLIAGIQQAQDQTLQLGSSGSAVSTLQAAIGGGAVTGQYDSRTRSLVTMFQTRRGLARTGVVNRATWASVLSHATGGAAVLSPLPAPAPAPDAVPQPAPAPGATTPPVTVAFSRATIRLGGSTTLTVDATPAGKGRTALRQQLLSGRWTTLSSRALDGAGRQEFAVTPNSKGVKTYRVLLTAAGSAPATASPAVRLTVQ